MTDKIIKNNIRQLRQKAGLTQAQLAKKIGISQVHLGRLENNARSMDLEQVENIAAALGVKPLDVLPPSWKTEEVSPEELEILRMIRKTAGSQNSDNQHISAPAESAEHSGQPLTPPQKSNER